jgi:hypothetical protein
MTQCTCHELGVCQARIPACTDCPERYRIMLPRPYLAPGVIDGPYRRAAPVATALKVATAWLMGPHP